MEEWSVVGCPWMRKRRSLMTTDNGQRTSEVGGRFSVIRPFDCLQCSGVNLNQVCVDEQITDVWPQLDEQAFEVGLADVAQTDPDHLGWRPMQHDAIKKIGVASEDGPIPFPGMTPEQAVTGLSPDVGGVGTVNWQKSCKRGRQVFVDE